MKTVTDMINEAYDNGDGARVTLWAYGKVLNYEVMCVVLDNDTLAWYFIDNAEHRIDQEDAQRLLDCFHIGYAY